MTDQQFNTIPDEIQERWLPIPGFPGYEVSDQGRVRSYWKRQGGKWCIANMPQKILKPKWRAGYPFVNLAKNRQRTTIAIHRLILFAFVGPPPPRHECCHQDGDRSHCTLDNLRWGTRMENVFDKFNHGHYPIQKGMDNPNSKLNDGEVMKIIELHAHGYSKTRLANIFGITSAAIHRIVTRRSWHHLI